jgi:hypothetical protein
MPSNIAKGIAPISAAAIWTVGGNYLPVKWTVSLVVSSFSSCVRPGDTSPPPEKSSATVKSISSEHAAV